MFEEYNISQAEWWGLAKYVSTHPDYLKDVNRCPDCNEIYEDTKFITWLAHYLKFHEDLMASIVLAYDGMD